MYDIITGLTLVDLIIAVNAHGGEPAGGPLWDESQRRWVQAVVRRPPIAKPGEVRLQEPKRK